MAKKTRISKEQTQKQSSSEQRQLQNINIRIGDVPKVSKKKRRRAPRKRKDAEPIVPTRQLPPVVYQTLPQVTYYGTPSKTGSIVAKPEMLSSIVEPVKTKTTILEDVGMVGTEGPVEILDKPTKRETLQTLITPIVRTPEIPLTIVDPVEQGKPFDIPLQVIKPAESPTLPSGSSFDIPKTIIDPPQEPSPAILRSEKATSITEIKPNIQFAEISNIPIPITEISDIPIPSKKQRQPRRPKAEIQRSIELGLEKPRSVSRKRYGSVPSFFTEESFGLPAEDVIIAQESVTPKPKPKSGLKIRSRSPKPGEKATQQTLNQLFGVKPTSV
jgi:hypothetical protein